MAGQGHIKSPVEEVADMNTADLMGILSTDEFGEAIGEGVTVDPVIPPNRDPTVTEATSAIFAPPRPSYLPQQTSEPYVEVIEQPKSRALRFRYQCEGRSAGSIAGEHSRPEKKTSPTIKIHNYQGPLIAVVSCVTNEVSPRPHPHSLVGTDCMKGVCTLKVKDRTTIPFSHLGIQCARKKDIEEFLKVRKDINVDPFSTGFDPTNKAIDLNVVRLCFQVFLPDKNNKFTRILKPVCSNAIFDKKVISDLTISRIDRVSGRARGGDEVFLLCDKIVKDDIAVVFQLLDPASKILVWEGYGEFGGADVHKQYAVVFKTPPFRDVLIKHPVEVEVKLKRPSDGETSMSVNFVYMPENPDQYHIIEKKKRKTQLYDPIIQETLPSTVVNPNVKERLRVMATRKIKMERGDSDLTTSLLPSIPPPINSVTAFTTQAASATVTSDHSINQYGGQTNYPTVTNWLNTYGIDSANLAHPTQVNDQPEFTTLQMTDLTNFLTTTDFTYNIDTGETSLGDISSGDLLMTSLDPPIPPMENISSES